MSDDSHNHSHSGHDHSHAGHSHGKSAPVKILIISIVITLVFAGVEAVGGWWSHSLALMGDAGHMAADSFALMIAAFAAWMSSKPATTKHSYGLGRAEVVAGWFSSLLMVVISIAIVIEAIERFRNPQPIQASIVMLIASIGFIVNLLVAYLLSRSESNLNIRAALLHVMGDLLGSLAALISGAVIYYTHWYPIDPILSIFISILIIISSYRILKESLRVLMEGVPASIDITQVKAAMQDITLVSDVHDLHVWSLTSGKIALSAHVDIKDFNQWQVIFEQQHSMLRDKFNIQHITLQPEIHTTNNNKPCSNCDE